VDASAKTMREMHRILPHGFRIHLRDLNQHDAFQSSESVRPITTESVFHQVQARNNPYVIMSMVMLMPAMRVVVFMSESVIVTMPMSVAMRMSMVRMTAHCQHAKQIDT
jgi:hypothetical protein